jgi:hypothetical protein
MDTVSTQIFKKNIVVGGLAAEGTRPHERPIMQRDSQTQPHERLSFMEQKFRDGGLFFYLYCRGYALLEALIMMGKILAEIPNKKAGSFTGTRSLPERRSEKWGRCYALVKKQERFVGQVDILKVTWVNL